jgi:hypothetical protein
VVEVDMKDDAKHEDSREFEEGRTAIHPPKSDEKPVQLAASSGVATGPFSQALLDFTYRQLYVTFVSLSTRFIILNFRRDLK